MLLPHGRHLAALTQAQKPLQQHLFRYFAQDFPTLSQERQTVLWSAEHDINGTPVQGANLIEAFY
jgi:hypothetical protein